MTPQPLNSEPALGPVEGRAADEIQGLCDAATPGPWSFYLGDLWAGATADELATADRLSAEHVFSDEAEDIFERASHLFHGDPVRPEDAEFIAAARDLVPSLLAEVEAAHRFERSVAVEREALLDERDSLRGVVQAVREWVVTFDCDCFGGSIDQDAERCDRCTHLALIDGLAAAADAPQPEDARCSATHQRYGRCDLRAAHGGRHTSDIGADGPDDPGDTWALHGSVAFRNGPRIPS